MSDIVINNSNVVINNEFRKKRANYVYGLNQWKRTLKIGKLRIYVTWNWKLKPRGKREKVESILKIPKHRKHVYERAGGICEICGNKISNKEMELHHVLPISKFKFLADDERNMQCLCHKCHKSIHCNPWKEIAGMEEKAQELGIDLKEYYTI